jgi:hypothetical protein
MAKHYRPKAAQEPSTLTAPMLDPEPVVITAEDLDHPMIKAWFLTKEKTAARDRILGFAATLLGSRMSLAELVVHFDEDLSMRQQSVLIKFALTNHSVAEIAQEASCGVKRVHRFYRALGLRQGRPKLTAVQKSQIRECRAKGGTLVATANEVGCSYHQLRAFLRKHHGVAAPQALPL